MFCLFVQFIDPIGYILYINVNMLYVLCSMGAVLPANQVNLILSYTIVAQYMETQGEVCQT